MLHSDQLLERNRHYAATGKHSELAIYPARNAHVSTCLHPRTDPALFLKLKPGDAAVMRNAGGRVTERVIEDLAYISYLSAVQIGHEGPLFEILIIHHTGCGTSFLDDPAFRHKYAQTVHADEAALADEAVSDPEKTVRTDVDRLLSATTISRKVSVSGHVYDVTTGLLRTVVPRLLMPQLDAEQDDVAPESAPSEGNA